MKQEKYISNLVLLLIVVLSLSFASAVSTGSYSDTIDVEDSDGNVIIVVGPDTPNTPTYTCGDNRINQINEVCDGSDMGTQTCASKGYASGALKCASNCKDYDYNSCVAIDNGNTGGSGGSGGSSGGSGGSSSCDKNWKCGDWGYCINNSQSRTCTTVCGLLSTKPEVTRTCTVEGASGDEGIGLESKDNGGWLTGAAIGTLSRGNLLLIIILIVVVIALFLWVMMKNKKGGKGKSKGEDVVVKKK